MAMDRIEYIKEKYSVLEYARDVLGLPVRKSGDRCVSLAPNSHNPTAMVIYDNWWYDFKQGCGGDVIDLCAEAKYGGDKGQAIRELCGDIDGVNWKKYTQNLCNEIDFYHESLRECDYRYLRRRRIYKTTIDRIRIGYDAKTDRLIIPYQKNGYIAYYVGRDRSGKPDVAKYKKARLDGFNENIPWGLHTFEPKHREEMCVLLTQKYKKIEEQKEDFAVTDTPPAVTHPVTGNDVSVTGEGGVVTAPPKTQMRNLTDIQNTINKYVVIAEGAFDALSFEQEGFKVLSPISGYFNKGALKQVIHILKANAERVFVCFDSDNAGTRFTLNMCELLFKNHIDFVCGVLPNGVKDVSDYYAAGNDLFDLIDNARNGIAMLAERITDRDEFKRFIYDAARFVEEAELIELCENVKQFSSKWLAIVLKKALKTPPEREIIREVTEKYTLKHVEGLGFYEYIHGVWIKRSDNLIGNYFIDLLGQWANGGKINSLLGYLEKETTTNELFNRKPIFNFMNGVLELETGKFREHSAADMSSIQVPYEYDENADCPRWIKFINEVMADRETSIMLLQEMVGYILFNDCSLQKCFFLIGDGANGKSVFLNTIKKVVGEANVSNVEMSGLIEPFQRINLIDSLVNISTETSSNIKGAESFFKQIVVGDTINGCYKNKDYVNFNPRCVMISACNEYIKSRDNTAGFLRRICFIDFPKKFEGERADRDLEHKLINELSGIFNWAYEGFKRLKTQKKFTETPEQVNMMNEFRKIINPVAAFIEECLMNENGLLSNSELYQSYVSWTKDAGHEAQSRNKFIQNFRKTVKQILPYVQEKTIHGYGHFDFNRQLLTAQDLLNEAAD